MYRDFFSCMQCRFFFLSISFLISVRTKAKDLVDFIQDDERLREERKKAKKNRDKYIGMSGDNYSTSRYSMSLYSEEKSIAK